MIFSRLFFAVGCMCVSYILSVISLDFAKSFSSSRKPKALVSLFVFVNHFTSVASLFVGLFMHYHIERQVNFQRGAFDKEKQDLQQQIASLSIEIANLRLKQSNNI